MMWWAFHEEMLDRQLAALVADRQKIGLTEDQAKIDAAFIKNFLASNVKLLGGKD